MFLKPELIEDIQNLQSEAQRNLWLVADLDRRIAARLEQARGEASEEAARRLHAECEEFAHVKIGAMRQLEESVQAALDGLREQIDSIQQESAPKASSSKALPSLKDFAAATRKQKKKGRGEAAAAPAPAPAPLRTVYCPCGVDIGEEEIGCDTCERWFHPSCVDFPKGNVDTKIAWFCTRCREKLCA